MTAKPLQDPLPATPPAGLLDRYFGVAAAGSTVARELRAGLTTFLTMSYVLFVNPLVLGNAIAIPNAFAKLLVVTALAAAIGTFLMAFVARYPFAVAPGMGLNAYFAYTVVIGQKIPYQTALGAVFISGVIFVALSLVGARQAVARAIPLPLKYAVTAGIGAFLAFIGLKNCGLIVPNPATLVTLGSFGSAPALIAVLGFAVTASLLARRVPAAIVFGIVAATLVAVVTRAPVYPGAHDSLVPFSGLTNGILALPVWPTGLIGALDIRGAIGLGLLTVVFTFFLVDFFDATGTLVGLASKAGFLDARGDLPRSRATFTCDGLAAMIGAALGTSTTTAYIESAAGIEEGGRTGLTAATVGVLFLAAMLLWPIAGAIPAAATSPALVIVGAMMLERIREIDWDDYAVAIPVFLTIIAMPLTFSIANGVSFGVISYAGLKLLAGRGRDVDPLLYGVAVVLIARYVWLS
jgi:AGZA family xanthine/uracil permease-like MFS transporter